LYLLTRSPIFKLGTPIYRRANYTDTQTERRMNMTTATQYDALDLFDQVLNNVLRPRGYEAACKPQAKAAPQEVRVIRLDVSESETAYHVAAELPGVRKEDIQIDIEGKMLVISAQVAAPVAPAASTEEAIAAAAPATRKLLVERFQGKLSRRLQLPEEVDADSAQAGFTNGVLELTLPKQKQRNGRRLQVQ
jgi:HSP20 family protein